MSLISRHSPTGTERGDFKRLGGDPGIAIQLRGIRKVFPPQTVACDGVDLDIRQNEVLALLGENGAGKTTLMSILSGLVRPTAGSIAIAGRPVEITNPRVALRHGIGMVHQHFLLVPPLTVAENIGLGREPGRVLVDRRRLTADVAEVSRRFGLDLDPHRHVSQLSVGMQQRVEIVKALYAGATVLILDEPTSVLTPQEADRLFQVIRDLARAGRSVVFISHKLREVREIADRIVVLRQGKVVAEVLPDTSEAELASLMVGRPVLLQVERPPAQPGEVALRLENVEADGRPGLRGVSFEVRRGEIFGIAGVDGNGQAELEEVLTGLRPVRQGSILLEGRPTGGCGPRRLRELGLAHIPSDRARWGLVGEASLAENLALADYHRSPFSKRGLMRRQALERVASEQIGRFDIRASDAWQPAAALSGGNQQKLVIAREVSRRARVLVAAQPTRGIDVGATEFVHRQLIRLRSEGTAVVLISADLDEVLGLSDRVGVFFEGRLLGITRPEDRERIALWMAGVEAGPEAAPGVR
ncbi:MAG TPA: ABC transporter ATP-binding protein [Candidatus Dormibacteraeota bacterium]|nr:ABC transporter ATP-binding protein [Candidatus Dormibacteraeota bacterium]